MPRLREFHATTIELNRTTVVRRYSFNTFGAEKVGELVHGNDLRTSSLRDLNCVANVIVVRVGDQDRARAHLVGAGFTRRVPGEEWVDNNLFPISLEAESRVTIPG